MQFAHKNPLKINVLFTYDMCTICIKKYISYGDEVNLKGKTKKFYK